MSPSSVSSRWGEDVVLPDGGAQGGGPPGHPHLHRPQPQYLPPGPHHHHHPQRRLWVSRALLLLFLVPFYLLCLSLAVVMVPSRFTCFFFSFLFCLFFFLSLFCLLLLFRLCFFYEILLYCVLSFFVVCFYSFSYFCSCSSFILRLFFSLSFFSRTPLFLSLSHAHTTTFLKVFLRIPITFFF